MDLRSLWTECLAGGARVTPLTIGPQARAVLSGDVSEGKAWKRTVTWNIRRGR